MAINYNSLATTALTLITNAGKAVTFTLAGSSGGTDYKGDPLPDTPNTTYSGQGVFLNYKTGEVDGTTISTGDMKVIYSGERPAINSTVDYDGETWRVIKPKPLTPADINLLYTVQIRR